MATERVDKQWQQRDLGQYSTGAILGTLEHYGIRTDEQAFAAMAKTMYPVGIARLWHQGWKGTGQFLKFHVAAADALWHRLMPGEVAPVDVALALLKLITALNDLLAKKEGDGTLETRFKVVENYLTRLPSATARRDAFEVEVVNALGDEFGKFGVMGARLARGGQRAEAERFTVIVETLFPVRAGTAHALMRAAAGDLIEAKAELEALAADASRPFDVKLAVVDAFVDLKHPSEAHTLLVQLLSNVDGDLKHLSQVVDRAMRLGRELPKEQSRALLITTLKQAIVSLTPESAP